MTPLNLGLQQFAPGIPPNTAITVGGHYCTGKTVFAAHVAGAAAKAGQRVVFIDSDHLTPLVKDQQAVVHAAIVDAVQSGKVEHICLPAVGRWVQADLTKLLDESLTYANLVVFDDMARAYLGAADTEGVGTWQVVWGKVAQRVRRSTRPVRALATYATIRPTVRAEQKDLPPGVPPGNDPVRLASAEMFPVVVRRDPGSLAVEMRRR